MSDNVACRRTREGLTEYLEGALSPARRQGLERHLAGCERCREMLAQTESIIAASDGGPRERMPEEVKTRLLRKLAESGESEGVRSGPDQG